MSRRFTLAITLSAITLLSAAVVWLTDGRATSDATGLADTTPQGPGLERYVDPVGGFFFDYPAGFKVTVSDDGDSHTIFGDTPKGDTQFMVVSYPWAMTGPLTAEYIRGQSFADQLTSPIEPISLLPGISAFITGRTDTPLGATRDALFLHDGVAYQVSVVTAQRELFDGILQTWRFTSPSTP